MATHPKAAVEKTEEAPAFKDYISTGKHTYPPNVQIKGEVIAGAWNKEDGLVKFSVPAHLVEGFEGHYHFTHGNFVAM